MCIYFAYLLFTLPVNFRDDACVFLMQQLFKLIFGKLFLECFSAK
jgi:hypothetical protein